MSLQSFFAIDQSTSEGKGIPPLNDLTGNDAGSAG